MISQPPIPRLPHARSILLALLFLAPLAALSACAKPILSATDQRSPFDRYDLVRGDYAPQYVENKFGHREPNLRGRLEPKN